MRKSSSDGKFVSTCKICKLIKTHPALWTEIHERVLKNNESMRSVRIWLNDHIKMLNIDVREDDKRLRPFSDQNFVNHFSGKGNKSGHCTDRIAATVKLRNEVLDKKKVYGDEHYSDEDYSVADAFFLELTGDYTEYTHLSDYIHSLEVFLGCEESKLKEKVSNNQPLRSMEIENFQKQLTAIMSLKKDLIALRNTAPITGKAIKEVATMLTSLYLEQLMTVTDEIGGKLKTEFPHSRVPDEVIQHLRTRVSSLMKSAVPDVLKRVSDTYKIKLK